MKREWRYTVDAPPREEGWYAVQHGWEEEDDYGFEAPFSEVLFWQEAWWDTAGMRRFLPVGAYAGPFENKREAQVWLDEHDPEI